MNLDVNCYEPPKSNIWQGRADSLAGERFFQMVEWINLQSEPLKLKEQTILLGFSSDEGVRRNCGRLGARLGPNAIRQQLAKLACHTKNKIFDIGNIVCADEQLELAQDQLSSIIEQCHHTNNQTIVLGGGHEVAWPHFRGLVAREPKIGIINFDAHFDLRPIENQQGSSGTPFFQIKQHCDENGLPFSYCCVGIQPTANTKSLFKQAQQWNVSYLTAEQLNEESFAWQTAFLDDFMLNHDALYLSICLDVFAECFAPGVSAPQALGINPWHALRLLKYIKQTGKVISIDVAELSPPLDKGEKTARLAAILLAELLTTKGI